MDRCQTECKPKLADGRCGLGEEINSIDIDLNADQMWHHHRCYTVRKTNACQYASSLLK